MDEWWGRETEARKEGEGAVQLFPLDLGVGKRPCVDISKRVRLKSKDNVV